MGEAPRLKLNDGSTMPSFGLGVWRTAQDETADVVAGAIGNGYRLIDTAAIYGNERGVGAGIARAATSRREVFVTTKLWNDRQGYDTALKAFDNSLARLGLETIDLYLIHWPAPAKNLFVETWRALVRLKQEGRTRSIGVSNFNLEHLQRIIGETGETPAVNQIELHPSFQQRALVQTHQALGIATQAWSPLGQGRELRSETVAAIASRLQATAAQVILRWHLDRGVLVIPKSANAGRIHENIQAVDLVLSEADRAAIDRLDRADGRIGPDPETADF